MRSRLCLKIVEHLCHLRISASGTPFPFLCTPTLNSTNLIPYSPFLTPLTPLTPTLNSNRGRKRKDKENQLRTVSNCCPFRSVVDSPNITTSSLKRFQT